MNRVRKAGVNLLRVLLSLAFLWLAYSLVRFDDRYEVRHGGEILVAQSVEEKGDRLVVVLEDGVRTLPKEETKVSFLPGFLTLFERMNKGLYFLVLLLFVFPFFFFALRWRLLLRATGFEVPMGRVFLITYIGVFFNNFLPGSVGGDIARGMIVARGADRKAALVGTILLDRIIGLGTMILLATSCVLPILPDPSMRTVVMIVLGLFFGMILAYLVYFNGALRKRFGGEGKSGRVRRIVSELDGAFRLVKDQKRVVASCALLSVLGQGSVIVLTYALALALDVPGVKLVQFFIFEPLIFIVTALPVSMGGWGVQEGAYAFFFEKVGVSRNGAIAISILYKLTLIFVSIPGGILLASGLARRGNESGIDTEVGQ